MYLSEIKKQGFEGSVDCSIEISLYEYGLVHKKTKEGFDFIYGVEADCYGEYVNFDRASYTEAEFQELIEDGGWFKVEDILSFVGQKLDGWMKLPLPTRLYDCIQFYGRENIFGDPDFKFVVGSINHPAPKED